MDLVEEALVAVGLVVNGRSIMGMFRYKKILLGCLGFLLLPDLRGQDQRRFLYVQSEPVESFEVVYAGGLQKSSASGYLILTGLPAQEIEFVLVLSGQSRYRVDMTAGDRGFSLRKQEGQWRLWDLSRNQWVDPRSDSRQAAEEMDSTGASPFARLLSKAAKDPTLLSNRRKGTVKSAVLSDLPSVDLQTPVQSSETKAPRPAEMDTLIWKAEYVVQEENGMDTVRVSIWSESTKPADSLPVTGTWKPCASVLLEPEFLQLRARMAAASDEEEMVSLVRRLVRTHCLSTSQAKRLSNIFLNDSTRFRFYDAVYGHLSDPSEFFTLGAFLIDPVYQKCFRALLER